MTARAYLGLGSNRDAKRNIAAGIQALSQAFMAVEVSPVYRSAAVGFEGSDFLNCAAVIETTMALGELKQWLVDLEDQHGRDRSQPKFSDRTLDIDILLYDDRVGVHDGLELPRDEILKYAHVLKPLADLAPELRHPVTGLSFSEHWERFEGERSLSEVRLR
ncbi:2-amino-4-hydroxy-6-hydroxymethyldihydropteridine diphosphokinase [Wenzhouxiangella sp. AB-CW3]|uniref:2-amino-4-hydroxy-6- hydroxymethyldihydropteridine diphosphokinase n=1 Tax=Wenzhouxiangella sp. AB-CW3 TaxID=2771012 RepID=UPI00168AC179|nr:2-amino-4-hydroxy-6-hydroxymethyldihydropteridine diphosphokinase [Wenzhouxiangella sp. AB-CW3]QOC22849.1 2-amino-4-hydroxy-6-hydroxymethyldihydropteridine diphosphokinase [Wenzhouxiangella sp. AB-CW3]